MNIKYSVIIPIYRAEKTLNRCVDSLICQNRSDVEIILINDGSPDSCADICRSYRSKYENIIYIEQRNEGVSSARNAGLTIASGEYILFVDSDDYVTQDYFSSLDSLTSKSSKGLIQFSFYHSCDGKLEKVVLKNNVSDSPDKFRESICNAICQKTINSLWSKIYINDIIRSNEIFFDKRISIGEDTLFNMHYLMHVDSYHVSNQCLYITSTDNRNSLSRNVSIDYSTQFEMLNSALRECVLNSHVDSTFKQQILTSIDFCNCRSVYHEAKLLHQRNVPRKKRREIIKDICEKEKKLNRVYPPSLYCKLIMYPVLHRKWMYIDILSCCLVHGFVKRR